MSNKRKAGMREIAISAFKAKCLGLLDEVNKTKTALRVTRPGKPIAEIFPPSTEATEKNWIGSMTDEIKIVGDIVSPVIDSDTIEALRD
jgi:antitoxin (DNA-binding transcriptional repressor) of toxin-antitoxin stability system